MVFKLLLFPSEIVRGFLGFRFGCGQLGFDCCAFFVGFL